MSQMESSLKNPGRSDGLPALLELLRHIFGSSVVLDDYSVANRRDDYIVLLASLQHPTTRVVIKLAGPDAPIACPFEQTAWIHNLVRGQTSVPAADVIAADTSYSRWPWRYLIKEYVEGIEWSELQMQLSEEEARKTCAEVGKAAAGLHSVRFARFGELPTDGAISGDSDFTEALKRRARARIKSRKHLGVFVRLLEERAIFDTPTGAPCLCHEDLHKHNIIFRREPEGWRLVSVLDFDSAWAGWHESDVARLEMWNATMAASILQGYTDLHPLAAGYVGRRPIFQLLWCLEYASQTARHLADTNRICAELGIPAIDSFAEEL